MTFPRTSREQPVELPLRQEAEPRPRPGCTTCLGVSTRRANCRSIGDYSGVSDANVLMRKHQATECGQ